MQIGGPKLAVQTVPSFTGLPINHVVVVDFGYFKKLIDAVGGVDDERAGEHPLQPVRLPLLDGGALPAVARGGGSTRASQHMNGERALIYSRVRENRLDPGENDLTRERGSRQ